MTKNHGIIFKAEMIKAYMRGMKTQTRRLSNLDEINEDPDAWKFYHYHTRDDGYGLARFISSSPKVYRAPLDIVLPYGSLGDELYFKETYAIICKVADPDCECEDESQHYVEYRADTGNAYPGDWPSEDARGNDDAPKWKSSMFMPRKHSRFNNVVITGVRVERLHDITPADVLAEGIARGDDGSWLGPLGGKPGFPYAHAHEAYLALWDSINAKKMPAEKNPWLFVYEFPKYKEVSS